MSEHSIYIEDFGHARVYLRSMFRMGTITQASQKDLERALVILAHAQDRNESEKHETESFRATVTQLLQVRVSEKLSHRASLLSRAAIAVSLGSFLVAAVALVLSVVWHRAAVSAVPAQSSQMPALRSPSP